MPLYDALLFISQTLEMYGIRNKIRIIADGRIISSFDILKVIALGADVVFTTMPRYKIISNPKNESKSDLQLKSQNESDFYYELMQDTIQVMKICGFRSIRDITLPKFFNRLDVIHSEVFSEVSAPALFPGNIKKVYNSIISSPN
jgi:glutamate synthase domain-containing protein 2